MLNNISIKKRLFLLTGLMSLALLFVGVVALRGISHAVERMREVYAGSVDDIDPLNNIYTSFSVSIAEELNKFRNEKSSWSNLEGFIQEGQISINENWNKYIKNFKSNFRNEALELEEMIKGFTSVFNRLLENIRNQDKEKINDYIVNDMYPRLTPLRGKVQDLIKMHVSETQKDYQNSLIESKDSENLVVVCLIVAILLALFFAAMIIKSITAPLSEAIGAVNQLTTGDTTMQVAINGQDESTRLMTSVQNMIDSTKKMSSILSAVANGDLCIEVPIRSQNDTFGKGLNHMVEGLKHIILEIQSEVNAVANSTQEIEASINQVSAGTSETAAAVTETTTSIEELRQTAHVSAEKAKDVLSNAEETMEIVKNSAKTLHLTVDEMNQIQEKMHIISQSIVKLSEHSMAIGEIINTVNNLAEQSNLLAVNAAIEAAKAGDQGKSFGVVAQEIRTLAEQSKEATVQVRAILNDIQNSTSAAILATEQGSKAVSKGVAQSSQLSEAIHNLSTSISKVATAANQISISSQQQLIGVDQVTIAMTNINEASNQHVEHMRQIENSVALVNKVAASLKGLVSQYKVSQGDKISHRVEYSNKFAELN